MSSQLSSESDRSKVLQIRIYAWGFVVGAGVIRSNPFSASFPGELLFIILAGIILAPLLARFLGTGGIESALRRIGPTRTLREKHLMLLNYGLRSGIRVTLFFSILYFLFAFLFQKD